MRVYKANIAGVGTAGALVACSLLLLVVVGALVNFDGWPGGGGEAPRGSVLVDEGGLPDDERTEVARNARAVEDVARAPRPGTDAAFATGLTVTGVPEVVQTTAVIRSPAAPAPSGEARLRDNPAPARMPGSPLFEPSDPDAGAGGPPTESSLSPPVNGLAGVLGDTTQGLTDGLGGTVGRLSPPLGETVTNTGRLVSDILRGLAPRPR